MGERCSAVGERCGASRPRCIAGRQSGRHGRYSMRQAAETRARGARGRRRSASGRSGKGAARPSFAAAARDFAATPVGERCGGRLSQRPRGISRRRRSGKGAAAAFRSGRAGFRAPDPAPPSRTSTRATRTRADGLAPFRSDVRTPGDRRAGQSGCPGATASGRALMRSAGRAGTRPVPLKPAAGRPQASVFVIPYPGPTGAPEAPDIPCGCTKSRPRVPGMPLEPWDSLHRIPTGPTDRA